MPEFKVVVSNPKDGSSKTIEVKDPQARALIGLKIGDVFDGMIIGLKGVKLKITGGSDRSGFPMLPGIPGSVKKSIILSRGIGMKSKKYTRKRKTIRGNTISEDTALINTVIVEQT
jgi:small subunit ribosomal protein S6e